MPKTLPKFLPLEEHQQIGRDLSEAYRMLVSLTVRLDNVYGKTSAVGWAGRRAYVMMSRLRDKLDDQVFLEHRDKAYTQIYYPGSDKP